MSNLLSEAVVNVIDMETTSREVKLAKVVECAMVTAAAWGPVTLTEATYVERMFNPGCPIPPEASAVHHITDEMVAGCPVFDITQWPQFNGMGSAAYVAHNAVFEQALIPCMIDLPVICTYRLAMILWPELEQHGNQFLRYAFKLPVPGNLNRWQPHRAAYDAAVTACVYRHELKELAKSRPEISTVEQLAELTARPVLLHRVKFGKYGPWGSDNQQPVGMLWADVPGYYLKWCKSNMKDMDADLAHTIDFYLEKPPAGGAYAGKPKSKRWPN